MKSIVCEEYSVYYLHECSPLVRVEEAHEGCAVSLRGCVYKGCVEKKYQKV
jgi:hypothetical protein